MKPWTVLIGYKACETYLAHVDARTPGEAAEEAKTHASEGWHPADRETLSVLAVFEGWLIDHAPEAAHAR